MKNLSLTDRATISNMAPEYGATCGFFPIDDRTIDYLSLTGRPSELIERVETYAKFRGTQCNVKYAEAFNMLKMVKKWILNTS